MDVTYALWLLIAYNMKDGNGLSSFPHRPFVLIRDGITFTEDIGIYFTKMFHCGYDSTKCAAEMTVQEIDSSLVFTITK